MVANIEIPVGGSDYAKITPPFESATQPDILHGRICVWTIIEKDSDWFNRSTNDKASESDKKKVIIPEDIAPNYRYFLYAFNVKSHKLIFEMRNEFRQSFGSRRAEKFFTQLFEHLPEGIETVDITLIPDEGSVDAILTLPKLRFLKIHVTRPNPEDLTDEFNAVMEKLNAQKARTFVQELYKAPRVESLIPDEETRTLAHVASTNGFVEGKSRDVQDSTKSHPKIIQVEVPKNGSALARFFSAFLHF